MKVFQVEDAWSRENVRFGTRPDSHPGPGQVRIRMRAAALNYRDLLVPQRGYGSRMQQLPLIMLSDGVGVADVIGGVTAVKEGDAPVPLQVQDADAAARFLDRRSTRYPSRVARRHRNRMVVTMSDR